MIFSLTIALLLQGSTAAIQPTDVAAPDTVKMSLAEVKAFNATVGEDHPYYIKCRKVEVTGSLVKRGRACRTTLEWAKLQEDGNEQARAIADYSRTRPGGQ